MIINKIGTYHGAPYRYINFLKDNPEIELRWIHLNNDKMVEKLKEEVTKLGLCNVSFYSLSQTNTKILKQLQRYSLIFQKLGIYQNSFGIYVLKIILKLVKLDKTTKKYFKEQNYLNWSGHNDVDYSLILTAWLKIKLPHLKITYSYKEHRCKFRIDEGLALSLVDKLIIPTSSSIDTLSKIYNANFANKSLIGDEDWRSKSISEYIYNNNDIEKLSLRDNTPHVLFLTRFAEYGDNVERRGSRINFINIINIFAKNNIIVHLKAMCICENIGKECETTNTPYHILSQKYPKNIFIEDPIILNKDEDYLEISKYDFGIIHNYEEGEETSKFSKINIPNRVFEYMAANVQPIVLRNTLTEVENIILSEKFGIIVNSYEEASTEMHNKINKNKINKKFKFSKSFEAFINVLMESFELNGNSN